MKLFLLVFLGFFIAVPFCRSEEGYYKAYTDIGGVPEPQATIEQVLSSRDEYHRKIFTLEGEVEELGYKKTGNGKKFTVFRFFDGEPEKWINVYARGFVRGLKNGSRIRIWGRYSKDKKYFILKRKNIMKAKKIQFFPEIQKDRELSENEGTSQQVSPR